MNIADILGVAAIFVIIGYVGYRSSREVQCVDDFTLAGSRLGRIQAGFSMAATEFGGSSLIGAMAYCYTIGIAGAWWDWAAVPALVLLGVFFAGKIKLPRMVTVTEFFERRYNRPTRTLATIMHLLAIVTQLSTQFMVGAVALNGVLSVPKTLGLLLSVTFVVLYTMGGGLIAVVNTDVVQFIIIVASIAVALPIALSHTGGLAGLSAALPDGFLSFGNIDAATVISWCLFCFFTYATNQHYIQRVLAAKDAATARFAFVFTGASYFVYGLAVALLGVCIVVLLPGISDPNMGYALLIESYMPAGVAGLILGGIFAASMSTADSMLLAASTLFVNDIYNPFFRRRKDSDDGALRTIRSSDLRVVPVRFHADGQHHQHHVSGRTVLFHRRILPPGHRPGVEAGHCSRRFRLHAVRCGGGPGLRVFPGRESARYPGASLQRDGGCHQPGGLCGHHRPDQIPAGGKNRVFIQDITSYQLTPEKANQVRKSIRTWFAFSATCSIAAARRSGPASAASRRRG